MRGGAEGVAEDVRVADGEDEAVDHDLGPGGEHGQVELRRHGRPARSTRRMPGLSSSRRASTRRSAYADEVGAHLLLGLEVVAHGLVVRVQHRPEQGLGDGQLVRVVGLASAVS